MCQQVVRMMGLEKCNIFRLQTKASQAQMYMMEHYHEAVENAKILAHGVVSDDIS
jgi:hypothetical protein